MSKKIDFLNSITKLGATELVARIQEDELRLKKLQFSHSMTPLENPQSLRSLRRDIARLKTQLRKVQIGA
jgi:large subunit ribosomal protein L29